MPRKPKPYATIELTKDDIERLLGLLGVSARNCASLASDAKDPKEKQFYLDSLTRTNALQQKLEAPKRAEAEKEAAAEADPDEDLNEEGQFEEDD